jgi:Putative Ig domain/Lecithin:cholesterol acyltransferase
MFPSASLINVNGTLYFNNVNTLSPEGGLWQVLPNDQPKRILSDKFTGELTDLGGTLYFVVNEGSSGSQIYRVDSTSNVPIPVTGLISGNPSKLTLANKKLYFVNSLEVGNIEPYVVDLPTENRAPNLANPIADTTAKQGTAFSFTIPSNTFQDPDTGDVLVYSASLDNSNALPSWLKFDSNTRVFSGTPTSSDINNLSVKVTATDQSGASVSDVFSINLSGIADNAGNTLAAARDIGILADRVSFDDFIGRYDSSAQDTADYYKFTLDKKSAITLSVSGIAFEDKKLKIELRNDKDEVIRFTDNVNDLHEVLNSGTYYARVSNTNPSQGDFYNFSASAKKITENSLVSRKPVFVIPGIGGSLWDLNATDSKSREDEWYLKRGLSPDRLAIDPLAESYSVLIAKLKNAGYEEDKDLFVVPYDWRLLPAPIDGNFDGSISGISSKSITDNSYEYGVDYLGYYLKKASEVWSSLHGGQKLDAIDIIAHSTGGLIARSYIQSNAYGEKVNNDLFLPLVDNLITLGVPNSGSVKAWNVLNNDWDSDKVYATVFRNLANNAYKRLKAGIEIDGTRITKKTVTDATGDADLNSVKNEIEFINQYVPTIRSLLSTDDFGVLVPESQKNGLLLDLNAESGVRTVGFNGRVSQLYSDKVKTAKSVEIGKSGGTVQRLGERIRHTTGDGEKYYNELTEETGDGTVIADSATFINNAVSSYKLSDPSNPFDIKSVSLNNVPHGSLPNNEKAISEILGILGQLDGLTLVNPFTEAFQLLTSFDRFIIDGVTDFVKPLANSVRAGLLNLLDAADGLAISLDPVEGFIIDSQGRRLGYSESTGAINEIPNSLWLGTAEEGIGVIKGEIDPALTVNLSGLGENHEVRVYGMRGGKLITAESNGFLASAEKKQIPLTFTEISTSVNSSFSLQKATEDIWTVNGNGKVKIALTGKNSNQLNEIGVFKLDVNNTINGLAPGTTGFVQAALANSTTLFTALPDKTSDGLELSHILQVRNGDRLGFFMVSNGSIQDDLKANQFNNVVFSIDRANPASKDYLQVTENSGTFTLDWEQGNDNTFKDLSVSLATDSSPSSPLNSITSLQGQPEGEILDLRAFAGQTLKATFNIKREAAFNNVVGFYKIEDAQGTVTSLTGAKFKPQDKGYKEAALDNKIVGLDLVGENQRTITIEKDITGGEMYAPYLIVNGGNPGFIANFVYTPFAQSNFAGVDHVRLLGDNTFGFEDLYFNSDNDFNDFIVQASFKTT